MKVGLVARSESRGIGIMTADFFREMAPTKTLVVDMGPLARGFATHPDWYPGATTVPFVDGLLPERECRDWLDGLDCVYGVETWYDQRFPAWAAEAGVATCLHVMAEFYRPEMEPTVCWAPTSWRLDLLPESTVIVPVPVEVRPPPNPRQTGDRLRVVHVAGHRAAMDRNGTTIVATALPRVRRPMHVTIWCQDRRLPTIRGGEGVKVVRNLGGVTDRWAMFDGADLLVMPRRYGGLSLPVQEAMASGVGVLMTDCAPNRDWPVWPLRCSIGSTIATPGGEIDLFDADPRKLAADLNWLADHPEEVAVLREESRGWAARHTWEVLRPVYEQRLAEAVALVQPR